MSKTESLVVCRCENVTWDEVERAISELKPTSLRQLKLITRWGMGICQGRVCRSLMAMAEVPDHAERDFRLTVRPPCKPIRMGILKDAEAEEVGEPCQDA